MRNRKQTESNIETNAAEENAKSGKKARISLGVKIYTIFTAFTVFIAASVSIYVYSWFLNRKAIAGYSPISSPDSLFIAAGHSDMDNFVFENIRYLYFHGIDASGSEDKYYDYLFCVYGKGITSYRLQLAYTTNNQFRYEIFRADEHETEPSEGYYLSYEMHTVPDKTYYYTLRETDENTGDPIPVAGNILNLKSNTGSELLAKNYGDNDDYYDETYDGYAEVNKYGVPLYWQTDEAEKTHDNPSDVSKPFAHYYILRIYTPRDRVNDRETDVICISATSKKSGSSN